MVAFDAKRVIQDNSLFSLLSADSLSDFMTLYLPCQVHVVSEYLLMVHSCVQATIAGNRYSCFCTGGIHKRLWSGATFKAIIAANLLVPLMACTYSVVVPCRYDITSPGVQISMKDKGADENVAIIRAVVCCVCSASGCVLSIGTSVRLFRMRQGAKLPSLRNNADYRLFVYSLIAFGWQCLCTLTVLTMTPPLQGTALSDVIYALARYGLMGLFAFAESFVLLALSKSIREKYMVFYRLKAAPQITPSTVVVGATNSLNRRRTISNTGIATKHDSFQRKPSNYN
ncbi:hypothetical protein AAVH_25782 [Aphelenchoides avenae]|nr:hypothetical protein AAVH_25782 [Aphelenchus avenae]